MYFQDGIDDVFPMTRCPTVPSFWRCDHLLNRLLGASGQFQLEASLTLELFSYSTVTKLQRIVPGVPSQDLFDPLNWSWGVQ